MAKLFYTLNEAAERLGVTPNEVRDLVTQGRLQEFRDRDKLMYKVDQVELLAERGDGGEIPLASDQSGTGIPILADDPGASGGPAAASGSGIPLEPEPALETAKERSGISIFDADETEQADPSAVTQITSSPIGGGGGELTMESVGSGSGLLDLTRESDDTSLGADLLQDVYGGEGSRAGFSAAETGGTSGLFETTGAASDVSGGLAPAGGVVMVAAEPFDGAGSGFSGGVALGALLVAALATAIVIFGITAGNATAITEHITKLPAYPWSFIGAGAGAVIIFALIGWVLGKKS